MGAYPALDIRPPQQPESPIEQYGKLMQMRNLAQAGELQQQQVQKATLENQVLQQQVKDQQTIRQAQMSLNAPPDATHPDSGKGANANAAQSGDYMDRYEQMLDSLRGKVMPQTYQGLMENYTAMRQKLATAKKDEIETMQKTNDQFVSLVKQAKEDPNYEQNWPQYVTAAQKLHPEIQLNPNQPVPKEQLDMLGLGFQTQDNLLKAAQTRKETAQAQEAEAELPGKQAEAETKQRQNAATQLAGAKNAQDYAAAWGELPAKIARQFPSPEQWTPMAKGAILQAGMSPKEAAEQPKLAAETAQAQQKARLGVAGTAAAEAQGRTIGEMNAVGGMFGAGSPIVPIPAATPQDVQRGKNPQPIPNANPNQPAQPQPLASTNPQALAPGERNQQFFDSLNQQSPAIASQVKALAEGRMAFPAGFALKSPYWQNMIRLVSQYDPGFDAINYNARAKARQEFTSAKQGTPGGNIVALNTVIGHLDTLSKAADDLSNRAIPSWNSVANLLETATGDPRVKKFDNARQAVADELTRVWRQAGGSESDIKGWESQLDSSSSPKQIHAVIAQVGDLLESRISALDNQYKQAMNVGKSDITMLRPESRATLDRLEAKAGKQPNQQGSFFSNFGGVQH